MDSFSGKQKMRRPPERSGLLLPPSPPAPGESGGCRTSGLIAFCRQETLGKLRLRLEVRTHQAGLLPDAHRASTATST